MKEGHPAVNFLVVPPILEARNVMPDQENWRLKFWNSTRRDSAVGNTGFYSANNSRLTNVQETVGIILAV
jgi:hypothetical protein